MKFATLRFSQIFIVVEIEFLDSELDASTIFAVHSINLGTNSKMNLVTSSNDVEINTGFLCRWNWKEKRLLFILIFDLIGSDFDYFEKFFWCIAWINVTVLHKAFFFHISYIYYMPLHVSNLIEFKKND